MKSNQEILDYLKPYTEMKGVVYKTLVEIIPKINNQMYVFIDIKSSWKGIEGTDTRHYSIKTHLKKNGFLYDERLGCYFRFLYKKYWNKV
jgi:hypothetical protein